MLSQGNTDPARPGACDPEILSIDLPHLRVGALAWGPPDGRLVLCLHGYPDTAWTWRHLGPTLAAQGYRVVAPFTRGYAPTGIPADGDYHVGALMYDAIALHSELGGSDAVLIGHDWGGFTAAALAAHAESPFSKVVTIATPLLFGFRQRIDASVLRAMPAQARKSWYVLFQQIPGIPERTLNRVIPKLWRDWCPPGYDTNEDVQRIWAALPNVAHRKAALSYYRFQFQPRRQLPAYRALHRSWRTQPYRKPMLLLHGEADGGLDVRLATFTAKSLPAGSRHEIVSKAGHFIHLDEPDIVAELILQYISEAGS
jgi:pimeloyl-ACP methyl ester carboxylesterase